MTRTIELDGEFGFFAEEINDPDGQSGVADGTLILPPCDSVSASKDAFLRGSNFPRVPRAL
jgi:hypothetical protein